MRTFPALLTISAFAPLTFAQLDSNSVTVFASRGTNVQADQVVFAVSVDTPTDAALNDVVAALQNAGITLANFASVRTLPIFTPLPSMPVIPSQFIPPLQVEWTFGLPGPISKLADTVAQLKTVQQSITANNTTWTMSFSVQGTQVSLPLQQSQACSAADLINDARVQAQRLASAAGMNAGSVLALSGSTSTTQPGGGVYLGPGISGFIGSTSFASPQICSVTVKFALK